MNKTKKIKKECCGIDAGQDCMPMHESIMGCIYHPDNKKAKKAKTKKTKPKKLKTYVITVMVKFPKKGIVVPEPTGFKKKILSGEKKHTIRQNYEFWKKRIDEINAGRAILSVRQWSGLPYRSEQKEIKQFKKGELGYQKITITGGGADVVIHDGTEHIFLGDNTLNKVVKNDGITMLQFRTFFRHSLIDGIIIHFTKKRY
jgi:hypothetical protein